MPVRVLDRTAAGSADDIAKGIRFAVAHGADVINMSFNFGCGKKVPEVDEALREAYAHGVVAVASVGNLGSEACVSPPATGPHVIGVGGTTEGGCLGDYSLAGEGVDVVAPGGGAAGRRLPLGLGRPDLPGDAARPAARAASASPATTSAPRWRPPTSPASRRWSSPAALIDRKRDARRHGRRAVTTAAAADRPQPRPADDAARAPA